MCTEIHQLILCSCEEPNEKSVQINEYQWVLTRFIQSKESNRFGKIKRPTDLDKEITIEEMKDEMNKRNCFDFDYNPQERDCLHMDNGRSGADYKYFNIIYGNGKWMQGRNAPFGRSITTELARGKVMKEDE